MKKYLVRVHSSKEKIERKDQLAWKIAEIASDSASIKNDVIDMVINRIIDNASVAVAAVNRSPVASARAMAIAHPRNGGSTVFGMPNSQRFDCEWATWAKHPAGARPFKRADYLRKFDTLTDGIIAKSERDRFISLAENLEELTSAQIQQLNVQIEMEKLVNHKRDTRGIF